MTITSNKRIEGFGRVAIGASMLALLAACSGDTSSSETKTEADPAPAATVETAPAQDAQPQLSAKEQNTARLDAILAAQPDETKARYQYRHPRQTLNFIGIKPGMVVADVLPGSGWYTKILLPYLGEEGSVVGIDYALPMWSFFGDFASEEFLAARAIWPETWSSDAQGWRSEGDASVSAVQLSSVPESIHGSVDAILMVRAFHHLNRTEEEGGFLTSGLEDMYAMLKPGGVVCIVQHRAPESADDVWAEGDQGYVKESTVIEKMEEAGFEFEAKSEMNANPKDQPTSEDVVWRLPPTLGTSGEDEALRAQMIAIGESDRMTMRFRKPDGSSGS